MVKPEIGKFTGKSELRYKGVRKRKWGKWVSEIRMPNCRERIWLGSYDSPEKAARAFDAAVFCLRGRKGKLNFPDDPPVISGGRSLSPQQIQAIASRYAHEAAVEVAPPPPPSEGESSMAGSPAMTSSETTSVGFTAESDDVADWSFIDFLSATDCDSGSGLEFSAVDDLSFDYFPPPPPMDFTEENMGGILAPQSFLWDF